MIDVFKYLPVKKEELPKFIVVSLMMLMILFIYSIQRTVKDTIVVHEMGAELLSAIKLFCTLPSAILLMLVYAKLSNELNKTVIFHLLNAFFITYFLVFTFLIHPNVSVLHFDFSDIKNNYPYLRYLISILENWSYSLYFVLAELWGSVMLSLMFWQTANQVFKIDEAKRLYPLFGLVAQIGMIISGELLRLFSNKTIFKGGWNESLKYINLSTLLAATMLSILFWILSNKLISSDIINAETRKSKKKIGFFEGLKHVFTSKYIGLIALFVICYGISINIVEGVWKAQAGVVYTNKQDYARFMANLQTYTGIASMVAMICGSYILSIISWRSAAMLTPVAILITGGIFFIFSIYQVEIVDLLPFLTLAPVVIAVLIGLLQNVLGKATKYAFFDATKEMAYIPLSEELKSKGKAAADVIGGRLGKSGGALIQQFLLIIVPGASLSSLSSTLFSIFLVIMVVWIIAVFLLAIEFKKASNSKD